eukprot:11219551-Lingulodinium_polyedra.AAC.1
MAVASVGQGVKLQMGTMEVPQAARRDCCGGRLRRRAERKDEEHQDGRREHRPAPGMALQTIVRRSPRP